MDTIAKKKNSATRFGKAVAGLALVLGSCSLLTPNIRTEPILGSVEIVVERHDNYVLEDEALSEAQKAESLGQSQALQTLVAGRESLEEKQLETAAKPVLDRHDSYVQGDESLSELETRTYLRSSSELRGLYED